MRTSTIARAGAALTASALALGLSAGPVLAAESETATGRVADAAIVRVNGLGSASGVSAAGTISAFSINSGVITRSATTQFLGTVAGTAPAGTSVQTQVTINGRAKGLVTLYPGSGNGGVEIPRQWGAGKVQLGPSYFADGTGDQTRSNVFYARRLVTTTRSDKYALSIKRVNSKITFKARQVMRINPSNGKFVSAKRVKLQQLKKGKWHTLKTIKLNSHGNGSYSKKLRTKYRYRLYSSPSSTLTKFETIRTGKI